MPTSIERAPDKLKKTLSLPGKHGSAKPALPAAHAGHDPGDSQKQVAPAKSPK